MSTEMISSSSSRPNASMHNLFGGNYDRRRVLVTGHTGFKGSWLCRWLLKMGSEVAGVALPPPTQPNHFELLELSVDSHLIDIRETSRLRQVFDRFQPQIVFHMAAQPLVRYSYRNPGETMTTNIIGTQNVYDACLACEDVQAVVSVTSDKVYLNSESPNGYRESDPLGGSDPYSCSKACAEMLTHCYRQSFFERQTSGRQLLVATVRAGNVIGGGDWAQDRIVADVARAAAGGQATRIRNPRAVRPWQHVLEPLAGYLLVGSRLLEGRSDFATAFNFGPDPEGMVSVGELVQTMQKHWQDVSYEFDPEVDAPPETNVLTLDSGLARRRLGWEPVWNFEETVRRVALWYDRFYSQAEVTTDVDLTDYVAAALAQGVPWAPAPSRT